MRAELFSFLRFPFQRPQQHKGNGMLPPKGRRSVESQPPYRAFRSAAAYRCGAEASAPDGNTGTAESGPTVPGVLPLASPVAGASEKAPLRRAARFPATILLILCRAKTIMPDAIRPGCAKRQPRPSRKALPAQVRGRLRTREYGSNPAAASRSRRLASSTVVLSCVALPCEDETTITTPRQFPHRPAPEYT